MAEREKEPGFLARWSRRKQSVQAEKEADAVPTPPEGPGESADDADAKWDAERAANREAAEAMDIDSLTYEDDFKVFMKDGVPDALRRRAYRKLWSFNPVLANLDGLNDYDDDFGNPADIVYASIWKVGRGFLSDSELKEQHKSGRVSTAWEADEKGIPPDAVAKAADEVEPVEAEAIREPEEPEAPPRVGIRSRLGV
ncbi:DUF3306 domain-containing protein [Oricola sp.]|uniref:DUF3306 domain-containing protein n=1 Tax=Oricola sp. TaxID=1979950 RepID=UPI003BAD4F04